MPPAASNSTNKKRKSPEGANDPPVPGEDDFEKLLKSGQSLDSLIPTDLSGKDRIVHADDALDFESEDELADDDEEFEPGNTGGDTPPPTDKEDPTAKSNDDNWMDDFAEDLGIFNDPAGEEPEEPEEVDEEAMREAEEARKQFEEEERVLALEQLKEWYPGFEKHTILKMNKLFGPEPSETQAPQPKSVRPMHLNRIRLEVDPDQAQLFLQETVKPLEHKEIREITDLSIKNYGQQLGHDVSDLVTDLQEEKPKENEKQTTNLQSLQLEVADWDNVLDISSSESTPEPRSPSSPAEGAVTTKPKPVNSKQVIHSIGSMNINDDDIYGSEDENAILNGQIPITNTQLDLNDSHLMFVEDRRSNKTRVQISEPQLNISNDRAYAMLGENYQRKVRSTIGSLSIDHSQVALRLQSPFYKVKLSKQQLRSWHRQKISVKPGTVIQFSGIKNRKKRKDKSKTAQELFARTTDLSLGDSAPYFLIEYSEEHPLVLSGMGMGSKLINYYRKRSVDDQNRPKLPIGETHVLDVQDRSAFWNFGFVEPGKVVPTLYNQMIRAPVFQHDVPKTDFLLVKSTCKARGTKYFLRNIPYQFVTGQVLPAAQIPGPHSRKVTTAAKNRLKMAVYRVLNKNPLHRLQVKDISSYFPDQNDMQIRQRLKEFMEYQRSGESQGFWKMKPGEQLFTEDEIKAMISPEDVVLLESMQVGQQALEDAGYAKTIDDIDQADGDQDGLTLDEQLTPWNISKNFAAAIQGKAMLQLHGTGDPTGRGEGFSLLRTSMKGGFSAEVSAEDEKKLGGHSYNVALQQKAYDEEIRRIWYAQSRSLSVKDPKMLKEALKPAKQDDSESSKPNAKVLQITRVVKDENDVLVRQTELVTDPRVIRAYMKHRRAVEEAKLAVNEISVTDDAEANKQRRKFLEQELARLNRNADRRQARKATKQDSKAKATTRKCATCGAVGHIKTNKSCPMYNDIYLNASK